VLSPVIIALVFLINTLFGIYIFLIMLRLLLQWRRVAFRRDPILRVLLKITDPPLNLLYNFIPGWRNLDIAAIILMILLKMLELKLLSWLGMDNNLDLFGLFIFAFAQLLSLLIYIFIFAIIIQAILSWITPANSHNYFSDILYDLTEPLLRVVRNKIQPVQGLDFSALIMIVILQLADILVVGFIQQLAL
jgi:YggT family protein